MDVTPIIDPLNPEQRTAVCSSNPNLLVLAGAGSGKTRVLVHRIAWLMRAEGIAAHRILAVTFTNKAAREMRSRIEELLEIPTRELWIGTFHGLAHRFLRRHAREAGLPATFQIIDTDDQLRIVKRIVKGLSLDEARWPPRQALWYINAQKEEGRRSTAMGSVQDPFERQMVAIYGAYEELCERSGLVDFAELLLKTLELLEHNPELLEFYRRKFEHILVDEFQDTNRIQYRWLKLIAQPGDRLFAVGDDDQSIYSWRGAQVENLQHFQSDFPRHELVRLEQNYRSTETILNAANALIGHNSGRLGKNLWTDIGRGEPLSLYSAFNELDEAYFVAHRIKAWIAEGHRGRDAAILYRSNAQSRQFEEKFVAMGIPYRVYGGLRFFERAEIKDALAYLRLSSNPEDDPSFERVINTPTRGIGNRTLDLLREIARYEKVSLWQASERFLNRPDCPARARAPLLHFRNLIETLGSTAPDLSLADRAKQALDQSGLMDHYRKEKGDQAEQRVENLGEFVNAARQFELEPQAEGDLSLLDQFLTHAALEAGEHQAGAMEDSVQMMTLHSAKGLEFDLVFVVGLEEGLFPSLQSLEDPGRLEEERRLCYVGITRARQRLMLSYAESRRLYGKETYPRPSRFLREIPRELLQEIRVKGQPNPTLGHAAASQAASTPATGMYRVGQQVSHAKFGTGVILNSEGEGNQARVQINFQSAGVKWLMLAYAQLTSD